MKSGSLLYEDLTEKIIGLAMKVHRHFGTGFQESIYKRALFIEFKKAGILCKTETEKEIFYEGVLLGKRRLDMLIENKVLIELKAISELDKACFNQIINYLKIFDLEVGLLINFGSDSLQFKRLVNSKH